MSPGLKLKHLGVIAGVCLLLAFQNCAQPAQEDSLNSSLEELTPFAYNAQPDTVSHMSCSGMSDAGPDRRAYFSFRVGAYNPATGGLGTRKEFREAMKYYNNDQRARVFGISSKNSNTYLSLSIRDIKNYQLVWKEGETRAGEELDAMLPELDSPQIAGPLAASGTLSDGSGNGSWMNYFPGSGDKRLMEGSLRYYHFENTMAETRAALHRGDTIMAVSYSGTADSQDTKLRLPDDHPNDNISLPNNRAYGTGFYLTFAVSSRFTGGEARVLSPNNGIREIDLTTNTDKYGNWDCNAAYQFMIVRPEDNYKTATCNPFVDPNPSTLSATDQAALIAIRRVLRVEDWFVDLTNRTVMPKRTGDYCYGPLNGRTITYSSPSNSCANTNTTMCPHFVSVCIKR
ncbi:MAG: hypothetical protein AB7H97_17680 [Pseudobdellovibrionaceae bacterium]